VAGAQRSPSEPERKSTFAGPSHDAHPPWAAERQQTAIFMVASPRPQMGKTFLARLAGDFLRVGGHEPAVFDLDPNGEGLQRYFPASTKALDIADTDAQMSLFDSLVVDDGVPKVVDIGHGAFERFFTIAEEISFFKDVLRQDMEPVVLYAADPHATAIRDYGELRRCFPGTLVVPVFNEAILKGQDLRADYPFVRTACVPLLISTLAPMLKTQLDKSRASFADVHAELPLTIPLGLAFELSAWTRRTFLEFRELELRLLLEKLRAALPGLVR
jgi:hypothetical protein